MMIQLNTRNTPGLKFLSLMVENQVKRTIENPEYVDYSRLPLFIAQSRIDTAHMLRVVYK